MLLICSLSVKVVRSTLLASRQMKFVDLGIGFQLCYSRICIFYYSIVQPGLHDGVKVGFVMFSAIFFTRPVV